jgi:topoisomerase-4 subunit A
MGNILTKNEIHKITLKQKGGSTLGGRQVWFDHDVLRLNYDKHGEYLGEFQSDDLILIVSKNGEYYTTNFDAANHYENNILIIEKFDENKVWSAVVYDGELKNYYLKRFQLTPSQKKNSFVGEHPESRLILLSSVDFPRFEVVFGGHDARRNPLIVDAKEFISVKSYKAKGKRLTTFEVETVNELEPVRFKEKNNEESTVINSDEEEDNENASENDRISNSSDAQESPEKATDVERKTNVNSQTKEDAVSNAINEDRPEIHSTDEEGSQLTLF